MPIYEYECRECGEKLEVIQKFSDAPLNVCPECRGSLTKLISNTSFVLKGSGWYADGYSSSSEKKPGGAGEKEPSGTAGKKSSGENGKAPAETAAGKNNGGKSEQKATTG